MPKPSRATQAKRERERNRQERAQEKAEKKANRPTDGRSDRDRLAAEGIDPDLIGIIPGPQPVGDF